MTQEDKELVLKDICARLTYGVIVEARLKGRYVGRCKMSSPYIDFQKYGGDVFPYLRPMSSMTEEEGKELGHLFYEIDAPCLVDTEYGCVNFAGGNDFIDTEIAEVYIDWLNAHHFDYRGLIPMDLALEAPEWMYNK